MKRCSWACRDCRRVSKVDSDGLCVACRDARSRQTELPMPIQLELPFPTAKPSGVRGNV